MSSITTKKKNRALKAEFSKRGLDLADVWNPTPGRPDVENRQLNALLNWVQAYSQLPDRKLMEGRGYRFPPVDPDCDPDSDWIRFERWLTGQATEWQYEDAFGPLMEPGALTYCQVEVELQKVIENLEQRGVCVDVRPELPALRSYEHLYETLRRERFEFVGERTTIHLDGCDYDCPNCSARRICEMGNDQVSG